MGLCLRISVVLVIGLSCGAFGGSPQWLGYRHSRSARDILGTGGSSYRNVSHERPEGLELPEFKSESPAFVRWESPMAAGGGLWIALDRQGEGRGRQYDCVWVDSNGDGSLRDEKPVAGWNTTDNYVYIGPVRVLFAGEDGPVTYHLNFQIYESGERAWLSISSGCWYEGTIEVDGQRKHCVLIDQNCNGRFNDVGPEAHNCDRIRIGSEVVQDTKYIGRFIEIDEKLYYQEAAADGAYIKLRRADDVKYGTARLPAAISGLRVGGENGLFTPKPEEGVVRLPVGEYVVQEWVAERKDQSGATWKLIGSGRVKLQINEDSTASLDVGEPIIADLTAAPRGSDWMFNHEMKGRSGERIQILRNGSRSEAPRIQVRSRSGKYEQTYSLEYG